MRLSLWRDWVARIQRFGAFTQPFLRQGERFTVLGHLAHALDPDGWQPCHLAAIAPDAPPVFRTRSAPDPYTFPEALVTLAGAPFTVLAAAQATHDKVLRTHHLQGFPWTSPDVVDVEDAHAAARLALLSVMQHHIDPETDSERAVRLGSELLTAALTQQTTTPRT